jgi:hypothetical protein
MVSPSSSWYLIRLNFLCTAAEESAGAPRNGFGIAGMTSSRMTSGPARQRIPPDVLCGVDDEVLSRVADRKALAR